MKDKTNLAAVAVGATVGLLASIMGIPLGWSMLLGAGGAFATKKGIERA